MAEVVETISVQLAQFSQGVNTERLTDELRAVFGARFSGISRQGQGPPDLHFTDAVTAADLTALASAVAVHNGKRPVYPRVASAVTIDRERFVLALPPAVITLPDPELGRELWFKVDGTASVANPVTIVAAAASTIDGLPTLVLSVSRSSVRLWGDGYDWQVVSLYARNGTPP